MDYASSVLDALLQNGILDHNVPAIFSFTTKRRGRRSGSLIFATPWLVYIEQDLSYQHPFEKSGNDEKGLTLETIF